MPTLRPRLFADQIKAAVESQQGAVLANFFDIQDDHVRHLYDTVARTGEDLFDPRCLSRRELNYSGNPWGEMANLHLTVIIFRNDRDETTGKEASDWVKMAAEQKKLVDVYLRHISSSTKHTGWTLPVMFTICRDLRNFAKWADADLAAKAQKAGKLEEACWTIMKCFTQCCNDRTVPLNTNRRWGTYYMAGLLFKTYFKLGTTRLCRNVIRGIESAEIADFKFFPKAHQVTYRYYMGVLAFLDERYKEAEEHLSFALSKCHRKAKRNQELILDYLIPLRLLRGVLPSPILLKAFNRLRVLYEPFIKAFRQGKVADYDAALVAGQLRLLERGTWLVVERAREGCLRGLLKKTWLAQEKTTRLPIDVIQAALKTANVAMDSDEVECVVANMIYKGHIKGYISHERQIVVLSKQDPFPALGTRLTTAT